MEVELLCRDRGKPGLCNAVFNEWHSGAMPRAGGEEDVDGKGGGQG